MFDDNRLLVTPMKNPEALANQRTELGQVKPLLDTQARMRMVDAPGINRREPPEARRGLEGLTMTDTTQEPQAPATKQADTTESKQVRELRKESAGYRTRAKDAETRLAEAEKR